jgi:hypothetical protein
MVATCLLFSGWPQTWKNSPSLNLRPASDLGASLALVEDVEVGVVVGGELLVALALDVGDGLPAGAGAAGAAPVEHDQRDGHDQEDAEHRQRQGEGRVHAAPRRPPDGGPPVSGAVAGAGPAGLGARPGTVPGLGRRHLLLR